MYSEAIRRLVQTWTFLTASCVNNEYHVYYLHRQARTMNEFILATGIDFL